MDSVFKLRFSRRGTTIAVREIVGIAPSFEVAVKTGIATFDRAVVSAGEDPSIYSLLSVEHVGKLKFIVPPAPQPDTGGFDSESINMQ